MVFMSSSHISLANANFITFVVGKWIVQNSNNSIIKSTELSLYVLEAQSWFKYSDIPYSTLSSLPPKQPTFSKIHEGGLDNGDFFFKNFQNFTIFLPKEQLEDSFIITASYLDRKYKEKDLVQSKF